MTLNAKIFFIIQREYSTLLMVLNDLSATKCGVENP